MAINALKSGHAENVEGQRGSATNKGGRKMEEQERLLPELRIKACVQSIYIFILFFFLPYLIN